MNFFAKGTAPAKKITAPVLIAVLLLLFIAVTGWANNKQPAYRDIGGHWAEKAVEKWAAAGIIKGYGDGAFRPDAPVTRAEFVVLVGKIFGYKDKSPTGFRDVPAAAWFSDAVSKAVYAGAAGGYGDGTFKPAGYINRQEAAVLLYRAFQLEPADKSAQGQFKDYGQVGDWSRAAVDTMAAKGYIKGKQGELFAPKAYITRAEAVKIIDNMIGGFKNTAGTFSKNTEGNLVVSAGDVTLKDMTVKGDLYLAQGIGEGDVTLENVKVEGRTLVWGGGPNSIVLRNTNISGTLYVYKQNGQIRIVAQGATGAGGVKLASGGRLNNETGSQDALGKIEITPLADGETVTLDGNFDSVTIEASGVEVQVEDGSVKNLEVKPGLTDTTIDVAAGAAVGNLTLNSGAAVTGDGIVDTANINVSGVTMEQNPRNVNTGPGINVGRTGDGLTSTGGTGNTGSGGGSGGGSSGQTAAQVTAASTTEDGKQIIVTFDRQMANPAGKHTEFSITANGVPIYPDKAEYGGSSYGSVKTEIKLSLTEPVLARQKVLLSLTGALPATDGVNARQFTDRQVVNAVIASSYTTDPGWPAAGSKLHVNSKPALMTVDSAGNMYVADKAMNQVVKYSSQGLQLKSWGGLGAEAGRFNAPTGIAIDSSGKVYVTDTGNHRIQIFNTEGVFQSYFGGFGTGAGKFNGPTGIDVDAGGNLYVSDSGNHRVQKFNSQGTWLKSWGSYGTIPDEVYKSYTYISGQYGDNTPTRPASGSITPVGGMYYNVMDNPYGIKVFADAVYVTDKNNHRIVKYDAEGNFKAQYGLKLRFKTRQVNYGYLSRTTSDYYDVISDFAKPSTIYFDSQGYIYITDTENNRVLKYSPDFALIGAIEGQELNPGFSKPEGVITDPARIPFVADTGNGRLVKLLSLSQRLAVRGAYTNSTGSVISVILNKPLKDQAFATDAFLIKANGTARQVRNITLSADKMLLTLTLQDPVPAGSAVELSAAGPTVESEEGDKLPGFGPVRVINCVSGVRPPVLTGAVTSGSGYTIIMSFDKPMADPASKKRSLTVTVGAQNREIKELRLGQDNKTLELELNERVLTGETALLSYNAADGEIKAQDGGVLGWSEKIRVVNNVVSANSWLLSAETDTSGYQLILNFERKAVITTDELENVNKILKIKAVKESSFLGIVFGSESRDIAITGFQFSEDGKKLYLALAEQCRFGEKILISYQKVKIDSRYISGLGNLDIYAKIDAATWPGVELGSFTDLEAANRFPAVPSVTAARTNSQGNVVTVAFDRIMAVSTYTGFELTVNGTVSSVVYARKGADRREVDLYLAGPIRSGQTVLLKYTPGNLTADDGSLLAGFTGLAVENTVSSALIDPPVVTGAVTDTAGRVVTISFDKSMADPAGKHEQFFLTAGGVTHSFTSAALKTADTIDLVLDAPVKYGQTLAVGYLTGDAASADGGRLSSFVNRPVVNNVASPYPVVTGAETNAAGNVVTVTFNRPMSKPDYKHGLFDITADGVLVRTTFAELRESDATKIDLTLYSSVGPGQSLLLSYRINAAVGDVTSAEGYPLAAFTGQVVTNNVPIPYPVMLDAATNAGGTVVTLRFDKAMANPEGKQNQFSVKADETTIGILSAALNADNTKIDLALAGTVLYGQELTINYTAGSVYSADNWPLRSFDENRSVTNNVPVPAAPTVTGAATNTGGTQVIVSFSKAMADPAGKHSQFNLQANGVIINITGASLNSDPTKINFSLASPVLNGQSLILVYNAGLTPVISADRGILAGFIGQGVTNNVPVPAPAVTGAYTNTAGNTVTISFNKAMANPAGKHNQFNLSVNGVNRAFTAVALNADNTKIDLTVASPVQQGQSLLVTYTAGNVTSAEGGILAGFSRAVTNNVPGSPPVVTEAYTNTDGTEITVTFNKPMLFDPAGKHAQFGLKVNGVNTGVVSSVRLNSDSTKVDLILFNPVSNGQSLQLSYTAGDVTAADGGLLASFTDLAVTNNVPIPAPSAPAVINAETNTTGALVTLTFNKAMNDPVGKESQFTIKVDGTPVMINAVNISGDTTYNFMLAVPVSRGQYINISYNAGDITATDGTVLASFTNKPVINRIPAPGPNLTAAATNAAGDIITVSFDKMMADPAGKHGQFTVSVAGQVYAVTSAALNTDTVKIDLTLSAPVSYGQTVTLSYAAGDVKSADGGLLAGFTGQIVTNNVPQSGGSAAPLNWQWRNPLPQGDKLNAVVHGSGIYVAVGDGGAIVTSTDGINWTERTSDTGKNLHGIVYGGGIFAAVGGDFTEGTILTSPDGITWTGRSSGTTETITGITYGNGTFVAAGIWGTILTSPDGITWTGRTSGTTAYLNGVTFGNGTFVTVGEQGTILTSPDGITWTGRASGMTGAVNEVTYGNGIFIAVGSGGKILTSPDGVTWTSRTSGSFGDLQGAAYGNGVFVVVVPSSFSDNILVSSDGVSWTKRSTANDEYLYGVTFGNGNFAAVGEGGEIFTSPDGLNWTRRLATPVLGVKKYFNGIAYGGGTFVVVGREGSIITSPDGINWAARNSGTSEFLGGAAYGNNTFVTVGDNGKVLTSTDGINWTARASGTTQYLWRAAYGNGAFVAVGENGAIVTSPDGTTWTARTSGTTNNLTGVTYGNGIFIAVGANGALLTSPDGENWTSRPSPGNLDGVTYGNGIFVAAGGSGTILTSPDGVNWTSRESGITDYLYGVNYNNGTFIVPGRGIILTSTDGVNWTGRNPGTENLLWETAYGNGVFVVVGDYGTILTATAG